MVRHCICVRAWWEFTSQGLSLPCGRVSCHSCFQTLDGDRDRRPGLRQTFDSLLANGTNTPIHQKTFIVICRDARCGRNNCVVSIPNV